MMPRFVHGLVALTLAAPAARAGLAEYVKKPDPSFAWKLKRQTLVNGAKVYTLDLTSQTWQGIPWKHDLVVVLPADVKPTATMFLWNQGGKAGVGSLLLAGDLAAKMRAPVAFLFGVPAQPLFDNLKEDALIAETFVRYLRTKDEDWPLLFPMAKSVVKAMDALQAFSKDELKTDVKDFVVSGASKRGWTTWLTAAADPRVKAIVPMVIDTLNMQKQLPYQLESFGHYSDQIRDYTARKLAPPPKTPEAQKLWAMVDPWVYRDRFQMPKLILNGTNDPYWTQDALNLYWDDLPGDKWICYAPNAGHNLEEKGPDGKKALTRAGGSLPAFARAYIHGKPLPRLSWKHGERGGKFTLSVTSDVAPAKARLWVADAPTRDFRKSTWKEQSVSLDRGQASAEAEPPASGCRAFFIECEYDLEGLSCFFSTQLRIVGKPQTK
ncbi:MAG: PhoPQ-activated protein PqaA family protein [Gemmataceae bacterium]